MDSLDNGNNEGDGWCNGWHGNGVAGDQSLEAEMGGWGREGWTGGCACVRTKPMTCWGTTT